MVLLPCSGCCGPQCDCPVCGCCTCDSWQKTFDQHTAAIPPASWYTETYYKEVYDDLVALLGECITRMYESQSECVNALVAQAVIANPTMTEAEIRAAFQSHWEYYDCQNTISFPPGHGWSTPYIGETVATPDALNELCPAGSPPSPLFGQPGDTMFWGQGEYTNSGTPDIRSLVLNNPGTGDWIADALLARGTQHDLPALAWVEGDDCASCATPAVLEFDCNPATDNKVFYAKTVTVTESRPDPCGADALNLCPPENCKVVEIKVTRTNKCASEAITEWTVKVAVCPCSGAFITETPGNANNDPVVLEAHGYESEAACIADLTGSNCLGGTAESRCIGNQWKLVRHSVDEGVRGCLSFACVPGACGGGPGSC